MRRGPIPTTHPAERVLCCGLLLEGQAAESGGPLSEAAGLVRAAGSVPVGEPLVQRRARPTAGTLFGRGKVEEIGREASRVEPDAVLVDNDLSPAQIRNLEKAWGRRVIDRSELIMDIFARRASTRQARLQVELAQVEYLLPRLRRMWTHLERIEGGIGTRGPGETQLETDRRLLRKRVRDLKRDLEAIERRKQRQVLTRADQFTIGLVGYTNAGKSTLLNRLTGASEEVADRLFATLDTRTRQWHLSDGRMVLLSDTVGFLQRLPHHLVASFHATLEEALNVDLLMHVVDASHPDAASQMAAVERVLAEMSVHRRADLIVLNKIDRVQDPIQLHTLVAGRDEEAVFVSARTGEGIDRLEASVAARLDERSGVVELTVPIADGRTAALARAGGVLLDEEVVDEGTRMRLRLKIADGALGSLRRAAGPGARFRLLEEARERYAADEPRPPGESLAENGLES